MWRILDFLLYSRYDATKTTISGILPLVDIISKSQQLLEITYVILCTSNKGVEYYGITF